jgi:signal peptidase I
MSSDNSSDRTDDSPVNPPTDPKQAPPVPKQEHPVKNFLADNLPTVAVAVLLAVGVRIFVAEPRFIPSESMLPTLLSSLFVGANPNAAKLLYLFHLLFLRLPRSISNV